MVSPSPAESPGKRDVGDYALLWANGKSFREIYELMKADIQVETLEWKADQDRALAELPLRDDEPIPYKLIEVI